MSDEGKQSLEIAVEEYNNKKNSKKDHERDRDVDIHKEKLLRRNKNVESFLPYCVFSL
jgi:hypothetical protein